MDTKTDNSFFYATASSPFVISAPVTKSILHIVSGIEIHSSHEMPNRWNRFWQRTLLGWTWERVAIISSDANRRTS